MGKRYGRFIFIMYLFTKCLYIANAVLQLVMLDRILGTCVPTIFKLIVS